MTKLPLLLLPGLLCDAEVWSHQSRYLSEITEITIPNLNHATTPEEMVAAVLDIAPPQFILVGHSMGGWVALEVIKTSPNRVLGLGLINTTALPDSKEKHDSRQAMILEAINGNYAAIIDKLTQSFVYNKKVELQVKTMLERNKLALINQEQAMLQRKDCISILETITCPTLIIYSSQDAVFKLSDSELLSVKIKHAKLSIIENCGHMSPMESPEKVTQLLKTWLKA